MVDGGPDSTPDSKKAPQKTRRAGPKVRTGCKTCKQSVKLLNGMFELTQY